MTTDSFYEIIKPTVYLARAYALIPFSVECGVIQKVNLVITMVVASYYFYGITQVYSSMYNNPILPKFEKMMLILQVTATSSVTISSWLVNHFQYNRVISLLRKLLSVEKLLVSLNMDVDIKYRKAIQRRFIITIAFFSLQNVMDNLILGENVIALFIIYTIAMLTLSHFLLLICMCRQCYIFINDSIKSLGGLTSEGLTDVVKLSEEIDLNRWATSTIPFQDRNTIKHVLKTTMDCHSELFLVCNAINKYFGLQILLNVTANILNVTSICYYVPAIVIDESDKPHHYMIISIKSVSFIAFFAFTQLWIMAHICSSTCEEANGTGILIHGIANQPKFSCFSKELDSFFTQLLHQKIKFSAHGFFTIDFSLINTVVMSAQYVTLGIKKKKSGSDTVVFVKDPEVIVQEPDVMLFYYHIPTCLSTSAEKTAFLGVIGVVITYIVILIQFQMSN